MTRRWALGPSERKNVASGVVARGAANSYGFAARVDAAATEHGQVELVWIDPAAGGPCCTAGDRDSTVGIPYT